MAKLNSTIKIKRKTQVTIFIIIYQIIIINPNGIIFNFYEMKSKYTYILLKDLPIPIQMFKFLLNEIINSINSVFT